MESRKGEDAFKKGGGEAPCLQIQKSFEQGSRILGGSVLLESAVPELTELLPPPPIPFLPHHPRSTYGG